MLNHLAKPFHFQVLRRHPPPAYWWLARWSLRAVLVISRLEELAWLWSHGDAEILINVWRYLLISQILPQIHHAQGPVKSVEQKEQPHKQKGSWTDLPVLVGLLWEPQLCQNPYFILCWAGAAVHFPFASFLSAGPFLLLELSVPQKPVRLLFLKNFLKISWKCSSGLETADDNRKALTGFLLLVCDLLHH